jgi:hypothetical protein
MYILLDDDFWKNVTYWSCNFSIVKLRVGIVRLGGCSEVVYWAGKLSVLSCYLRGPYSITKLVLQQSPYLREEFRASYFGTTLIIAAICTLQLRWFVCFILLSLEAEFYVVSRFIQRNSKLAHRWVCNMWKNVINSKKFTVNFPSAFECTEPVPERGCRPSPFFWANSCCNLSVGVGVTVVRI